MSIASICQRQVDTARVDEDVFAAAERMHQRNVGLLVVVDDNQKPVGVISDRDLVLRVVAKELDPRLVRLRDIMSSPPKCINLDDSVKSTLSVMRRAQCRRLPVVDASMKLIGIVSLDDIVSLVSEEFSYIRELLANEAPSTVGKV